MLLGHITGHWEPEFLLFAWGFKYLFSASNTNKVINVIKCSFLDFFVDILFLTVKIHLTITIIDHTFLCKWPNLQNRQGFKYLFSPLYLVMSYWGGMYQCGVSYWGLPLMKG